MTNHRESDGRRRWLRTTTLLLLALPLGLAGCGGGDNLAPVSGKVTYNGQPVTGGTLIFTPLGGGTEDLLAGRSGTAEIQPDGTYTVGTNAPKDGARIGKHRVGFTPPPQQLTEAQRTDPNYLAPPPQYMGMEPRPPEVEVKPGKNTIDLQLAYPGR